MPPATETASLNNISINHYIVIYIIKIGTYSMSSYIIKSRDSSVGIALGYGLDGRGSKVRFPAGAGNCSHHRVQNGSGAHPASYLGDTRGSFPGGKAAGRKADHSLPSSAEVKE
jgi:hypothetical protein